MFDTALPHLSTTEKCVVSAFSGIDVPRPGSTLFVSDGFSGFTSAARLAMYAASVNCATGTL
ncbi:hypothetical protein Y600_5504 [Burkholderia pseudomallei MSHR3709]|nr:hypothetical protein Y600_5504 [Burkholderia pseudomallei MSHR3709]